MIGVFFILIFSLLPSPGNTDTVSGSHSVSVSAIVQAPQPPEEPKTIIQFTGRAYPNSELTILRNGTFLANVTANASAEFNSITEITPGTYTFSIYGEDIEGLSGPVFSVSVTLNPGVTLWITGIFLGPTIKTDRSVVQKSETITLSGYTAPNSHIDLFISPETADNNSAVSDSNGLWSKTLVAGTDLLDNGKYEARVKALANGNNESEYSKTTIFTLVDGTIPDPCESTSPADLNCDGPVNLIDFSILMFYWLENNPTNVRADINKDGIVNIVDFSIMMFYWTG